MNEANSISELKEQFAIEYSYATLKFFHRKHKGVSKLYITTKDCYKVESGRLISLYFPNIIRIKEDYGTLTYTYRNDNETHTSRLERDSDDG